MFNKMGQKLQENDVSFLWPDAYKETIYVLTKV